MVEAPGIETDSGQPEITMEHQSGTISTDTNPADVSDRAPNTTPPDRVVPAPHRLTAAVSCEQAAGAVLASLAGIPEAGAGLAGSSRGFWPLSSIVICSCQRLAE
jgi:hypothetical protein